MNINILGINTNYITAGTGADVLVLHGWGANIDTIKPIFTLLEKSFRTTALDLPGFGTSAEPPGHYDVYAYAAFVKEFCNQQDIKNPVIIGHSFGGRLAIILAGKKMMDINKLILVDAAGVLPKRGIDYYIKVYTYKAMKWLLKLLPKQLAEKLRKNSGSSDYKNASDTMKKIFVRVVNEDLTYLFKDIAVPSLLIWGEKDDATPVSDGRLMEKLIPDAGLVVFEGAGHYSYLDCLGQFSAVVMNFLEKDIVR